MWRYSLCWCSKKIQVFWGKNVQGIDCMWYYLQSIIDTWYYLQSECSMHAATHNLITCILHSVRCKNSILHAPFDNVIEFICLYDFGVCSVWVETFIIISPSHQLSVGHTIRIWQHSQSRIKSQQHHLPFSGVRMQCLVRNPLRTVIIWLINYYPPHVIVTLEAYHANLPTRGWPGITLWQHRPRRVLVQQRHGLRWQNDLVRTLLSSSMSWQLDKVLIPMEWGKGYLIPQRLLSLIRKPVNSFLEHNGIGMSRLLPGTLMIN